MTIATTCRRAWIVYWSTAWLSAALFLAVMVLVSIDGDAIQKSLAILLPVLKGVFWINVFWVVVCAPIELLLWIMIPDIFRKMPMGRAHAWLATLGRVVCGWIAGGALMSL